MEIQSRYLDLDLFGIFYGLVRQIPRGMVSTYGNLARSLGDVRAARACGYMLSVNPDPEGTPCYRVVHSDGNVGKFTHPLGQKEKIRRLAADGIKVRDGHVTDFGSVVFNDFNSERILGGIMDEQLNLASHLSLSEIVSPERISAFDVSYDGETGFGARITSGGGPEYARTSQITVRFPYIPSYLSYREYPVLEPLLDETTDLLVLDANGILHPRRMGLASFCSILSGKPSIGVAKSLTAGKITGDRIFMDGEELGFVYDKKYFVSPGNGISLESTRQLMSESGDLIISLLRKAHNEANRVRQARIV
ncbi:MAG: endonuclease V [Candidatus Thermoplasmatota archaeon]|jgi:deoxyribonuclease V|nr:endonuclease V [Candidatus Thermoplasmatota archaeon]MCL5681099.1 endonuclease V [Candidatus Thermoplasmatota archaeon]